MSLDNEDDIAGLTKQRASREEVRRRNREIMERANAEMRDGKPSGSGALNKSTGKKELSRLGLIRQSREGSNTFWAPYEFHTTTPGLSLGSLNVDINIDTSKFTELNNENASQLFSDCLKDTCLIDEVSFTYLDLINPEEAYPEMKPGVDPLDEPLLTNEVRHLSESGAGEGVYTGHFLRKPQLMSNDLFTEGGRQMGSSKFMIPSGTFGQDATDSFSFVKKLDSEFASGEQLYNSITKTSGRPRRVFALLPDFFEGSLVQFKFDEKSIDSSLLNLALSKHFSLYEKVKNEEGELSRSYRKKRKYMQANRGAAVGNQGDDFHLLSFPNDVPNVCYIRSVGSKILLKRDPNAPIRVEEDEIRLTQRDD